MTAPQLHRASLLLALVGILVMLTAAIARIQPGDCPTLPNRDSLSHPVHHYFIPSA